MSSGSCMYVYVRQLFVKIITIVVVVVVVTVEGIICIQVLRDIIKYTMP